MPSNAPPAAKPSKSIFDPFNSSATGHQRAENRLSGSTSWRDSRALKLRSQFSSGAGGGARVSDTVGAGSLDFGLDGRTENGGWMDGAKGLRGHGQRSLWESMKIEKPRDERDDERPTKRVKLEETSPPRAAATTVVNPFTPFRKPDGTIRESSWTSRETSPSAFLSPMYTPPEALSSPSGRDGEPLAEDDVEEDTTAASRPQIFANLAFYINGSTAPLSDHQVKHMLSSHGGQISVALGRRSVTHVILGLPSSRGRGGAGGGLAASKMQKEIARVRGSQKVKFVTASWVAESVKAGKRLPESQFEALRLAPKGVGNISSMFAARDDT